MINMTRCRLFILLLLGMVLPTMAWADDPNDETVVLDGVSYHVLRNADDWARFKKMVADAEGQSDVNAIMDADFTVTEMVGIVDKAPF